MAANVPIKCPTCPETVMLRLDPGPEDDWPGLAAEELQSECPDHSSRTWKFPSRFRYGRDE